MNLLNLSKQMIHRHPAAVAIHVLAFVRAILTDNYLAAFWIVVATCWIGTSTFQDAIIERLGEENADLMATIVERHPIAPQPKEPHS